MLLPLLSFVICNIGHVILSLDECVEVAIELVSPAHSFPTSVLIILVASSLIVLLLLSC